MASSKRPSLSTSTCRFRPTTRCDVIAAAAYNADPARADRLIHNGGGGRGAASDPPLVSHGKSMRRALKRSASGTAQEPAQRRLPGWEVKWQMPAKRSRSEARRAPRQAVGASANAAVSRMMRAAAGRAVPVPTPDPSGTTHTASRRAQPGSSSRSPHRRPQERSDIPRTPKAHAAHLTKGLLDPFRSGH
jgi:hypothetical protein